MNKEGDYKTAKWVLAHEAQALADASERLDSRFDLIINLIYQTSGKVIATGLGKSGHVANKVASTLASTGTPSFFLHPSEAQHGDLGMISTGDVLMAFAYGGETSETVEVAKFARRLKVPVIAITGKSNSTLAKLADFNVDASVKAEACPHNLAPTASTTLAMAIGDAIAIALMNRRGFSPESFATVHPGGSLGRRLLTVYDLMHPFESMSSVVPSDTFLTLMEKISKPNFGIVAVVDPQEKQKIIGVVTDGDIRRSLSKFGGDALKMSVNELMSHNPRVVGTDMLALKAFEVMEAAKITSLFALDHQQKLAGIVRMHDLIDKKIL
jgi:arabinose-5-phosphate isomerase